MVPYLVRFIDSLTNVYVRFNRKRLKGAKGRDDSATALATLFDVLLTVCKVGRSGEGRGCVGRAGAIAGRGLRMAQTGPAQPGPAGRWVGGWRLLLVATPPVRGPGGLGYPLPGLPSTIWSQKPPAPASAACTTTCARAPRIHTMVWCYCPTPKQNHMRACTHTHSHTLLPPGSPSRPPRSCPPSRPSSPRTCTKT